VQQGNACRVTLVRGVWRPVAVMAVAASLACAYTANADASLSWSVIDVPGIVTSEVPSSTDDLLMAVACANASQCTVVTAAGAELTFDPASPTSATRTQVDSDGSQVEDVACPLDSQCTLVDASGEAITFNPLATSTPPVEVVSGDLLPGSVAEATLSCPAPDQCTMYSSAGLATTFNPQVVNAARSTTVSPPSAAGFIACPSVSECVAATDIPAGSVPGGAQRGGVVVLDPQSDTAGQPAVVIHVPPSAISCSTGMCEQNYELTGLACPTTNQCSALDHQGDLVTFDPLEPGSPLRVTDAVETFGAAQSVTIACPTTNACVTGAANGVDFADGDPLAAAQWESSDLGGLVMTGVACTSAAMCVIVGRYGGIFLGTGSAGSTFTPAPQAVAEGAQTTTKPVGAEVTVDCYGSPSADCGVSARLERRGSVLGSRSVSIGGDQEAGLRVSLTARALKRFRAAAVLKATLVVRSAAGVLLRQSVKLHLRAGQPRRRAFSA